MYPSGTISTYINTTLVQRNQHIKYELRIITNLVRVPGEESLWMTNRLVVMDDDGNDERWFSTFQWWHQVQSCSK
jgi:hypothetical protein